MVLSVKHEEVSPALAHSYLAKSAGNRQLNSDYVLSLAVAMESGKWDADASEIVFDEDGAMVDGHHRLHAIVAYGKPVRLLVKRGVSKSARGVIDTGRTRTIRDLFVMFRSGSDYLSVRKAALVCCVSLIVPGRGPSIRTLDAYDSWMRQFKEGIDAAVEIGRAGGSAGSHLRLGPVAGAFAFAHKMNPKKVEAFMLKVRDGVELSRAEPAYTLRALLLNPNQRGGNQGSDRQALSRKVLQATHADIRGREYKKAQAGQEGLDGKAIEKLVGLWTTDTAPGIS